MSDEKPREIAVRVLAARREGRFVEDMLDAALRRAELKPEDRRLIQELVYGVVRWQLPLDWLIDQKSAGKLQKPLVRNLLRMGLYQMFWLDRVPSYAAVNEAVEICKRAGLLQQAKFINAVLRGYSREADAARLTLRRFRESDLSLGFSHPAWLCHRWEERWGRAKTAKILEWNNSPAPTYARLNTLKANVETLTAAWRDEGVEFSPSSFSWMPDGTIFKLERHPPLASLRTFQAGYFYVQDPSTLLAAHLLEAQPGETILDLCAAPGGKTTFLAQQMKNDGQILAEDSDPARLKRVEENARRLGASCVSTSGSEFAPETLFDRVLVDAPCSNTGVMRRRVELRWRIQPEEIQRLALTQLSLLGSVAKRTRPRGVLVYSTCSLEPEENQNLVREFLSQDSQFELDHEQQLTPTVDGVDGAYCARMRYRPDKRGGPA